nr:hypothetical protein [Actinomycetota bacterium]
KGTEVMDDPDQAHDCLLAGVGYALLADRLFAAASGHLPVLVEGSQSPISVKAPCEESDLDLLVAVESGDDLTLARKVLDGLAEQMDHVPVPLSLDVVHARWLELPNFYSALSSTRPRRTGGGGPPPTLIGSARPPDASGGAWACYRTRTRSAACWPARWRLLIVARSRSVSGG